MPFLSSLFLLASLLVELSISQKRHYFELLQLDLLFLLKLVKRDKFYSCRFDACGRPSCARKQGKSGKCAIASFCLSSNHDCFYNNT